MPLMILQLRLMVLEQNFESPTPGFRPSRALCSPEETKAACRRGGGASLSTRTNRKWYFENIYSVLWFSSHNRQKLVEVHNPAPYVISCCSPEIETLGQTARHTQLRSVRCSTLR